MTVSEERRDLGGAARWWRRLGPARGVIVVALAALAVLAAAGRLAPGYAIAAAACVLVAGLIEAARAGAATTFAAAGAGNDAAVRRAQDAAVTEVAAALPFPSIVLDREAQVVGFNAEAASVAPALRLGAPAQFALRAPAVIDAIRRAVASGEPQHAEFSERVPVDRWFAVSVLPLDLSVPRQHRLLLVFSDLTPLRRVEEMRADFVANASHELRTPLAALSGFIDTLQGSAREDAVARGRFLQIMKEQAGRMGRLIDDLLSLSRVELNEHVRPDTPVDLIAIVHQVVDGLQLLARERGVEISVDAPAPVAVPGDRDELLRVFENLVENALKYGASGHRVEICIAPPPAANGEAGEARVSVRDFGPGIAPEHLPRLTERFYRVDVGHSRAEGGTGLGLSLVKHILNRHRGRLLIESTPGAGSTFIATLPALAAVHSQQE